jgi:hypothetical protein
MIVLAIRAGFPLTLAAVYGGISRSTLYDWLRRGERVAEADEMGIAIPDEDFPFAEFTIAVQKALAEWESEQLQAIAEAGKTDWRASAWLLERRFPQEYGRV